MRVLDQYCVREMTYEPFFADGLGLDDGRSWETFVRLIRERLE